MKIHCASTTREALSNWDTLGAALNVKPNLMAWALHARDSMQHRIRLGDRTVYKSDKLLNLIQTRLALLTEPLLDELPGNGCVYSYRRGKSPVKEIKKLAGAKMLIATDVKGFYDHVFIKHIEGALVDCGFTPQGGRLIARYCVVKRGNLQTLQQGCPASPALSNLVGYKYMDVPIQAWLRENLPGVKYKYVRYCDNVELFIYGDAPEGFAEKYKAAVKEIMKAAGFRTHDWATISDKHPKLNQRFLGVVLNHQARVEKGIIDSLRATLFNLCMRGFSNEEVFRFMDSMGKAGTGMREYDGLILFENDEAWPEIREHALSILSGKVAYVSSVNKRHGLWLKKLLALAKKLERNPELRIRFSAYNQERKNRILKYKDDSQELTDFIDMVLSEA